MTPPRLSVLVLLALAACDGQSAEVDPLSPDLIALDALSQDPDALIGTWDLVASLNAETGMLSTPATTGWRETWTFRRDGTVTIATGTGGSQTSRDTAYRVARRTYPNGTQDARARLLLGGADGYSQDFGTAGDVLVLDSTPVDGPQSRYRRR